jgi:hypothetical protein
MSTREAVNRFLFHLSEVNHELSRFFVTSRSDADMKETYAVNWAEKLCAELNDTFADQSLEMYKESVLEIAAIRSHSLYLISGRSPCGQQIYDKLVAANPNVDLSLTHSHVGCSLTDLRDKLGITVEEAADLKAYIAFRDHNENIPKYDDR